MFKITKDQYSISTVFITNTETSDMLNLGKLTVEMINILHKGGHDVTPTGAWNFDVTKEVADELARTAMKMKRPMRKKKEEAVSEEPVKEKRKQPVDVFNLIFGIED